MAWSAIAPIFARQCGDLSQHGFTGTMAVADGRVVHDAGGSEAQELAFVLAASVAYLRALEASGLALEDARNMIGAKLAADANQFMTMAKFRALRKLWARVETACGLIPAPLHVSAETSWRMMTRRDPYVNMLRATIATAAASFGGANAITVLPHTLALGLPDAATRRMARNIQLVLLEESNLARVSRSRRRLRRHRGSDGATLQRGLGAVSGDRKDRRHLDGAGGQYASAEDRNRARRARHQYRAP